MLFRWMNLCQLITPTCLMLIFALAALSHSISVQLLSENLIASSTAQNCSFHISQIFHKLFHLEAKLRTGFTEQNEWEWEPIEQRNDCLEYCLCLTNCNKFTLQPGNVKLPSFHTSWSMQWSSFHQNRNSLVLSCGCGMVKVFHNLFYGEASQHLSTFQDTVTALKRRIIELGSRVFQISQQQEKGKKKAFTNFQHVFTAVQFVLLYVFCWEVTHNLSVGPPGGLFQSPSSLQHCLPCPFHLALQIYLFHTPLACLLIFITVGEGRMRLNPSCVSKQHYKMCNANNYSMY